MTDLVNEDIKEFIALDKKKRELKEELSRVNKKMAEAEEELIPLFQEEGSPSFSVDGLTVYLRRDLRASCKDKQYEAACDALEETGHDDLVQRRFNANSLSARVREMEREAQEHGDYPDPEELMPDAWKGYINVYEQFSVRTRKS